MKIPAEIDEMGEADDKMLDAREVKLSRLIATALRHKPEKLGIRLDEHGWAGTNELMQGIKAYGREIDFPTLERIVKENNKQRFTISEDGQKIRANHGHSVNVGDMSRKPHLEFSTMAQSREMRILSGRMGFSIRAGCSYIYRPVSKWQRM